MKTQVTQHIPAKGESVVAITFDVEEHHRIEAAAHVDWPAGLRAIYSRRMDQTTRWLLDELGERRIRATFFVVGQIAESHPDLIRRMIDEGHEVASHSWAHRRVHHFTPTSFREDVRTSKDALEQAGGAAVVGFRAPTFSIMRETAWAIDVLAEQGMLYDSSIFPIHHDRYGVPDAPRTPFIVRGVDRELLELPLLTLSLLGMNLPVAGGGYFRLFPLTLMERGIRRAGRMPLGAPVLYFHPWEFDADQPKLPLKRLSKFRTYVGIGRSRGRFQKLLRQYQFAPVADIVARLNQERESLPRFSLTNEAGQAPEVHSSPGEINSNPQTFRRAG